MSTYQLAALNPTEIGTDCTDLQPGTSLCLGEDGTDCTDTYVVQSNDTCDSVAETYGLNTTMLYTNNPQLDQTDCDNMYVGEVSFCSDIAYSAPEPRLIHFSFTLGPLRRHYFASPA